MSKLRLYIDMDGTIVQWQANKTEEDLLSPGYFRYLPPMENMVELINLLLADNAYDMYILSAVLSKEAANEKREWLKQYVPCLPKDHMIFVPCGDSKTDYITQKIRSDTLLDDYSKNLHEWHGRGIKCMNGINGTHGTWRGPAISSKEMPKRLYKQIQAMFV